MGYRRRSSSAATSCRRTGSSAGLRLVWVSATAGAVVESAVELVVDDMAANVVAFI